MSSHHAHGCGCRGCAGHPSFPLFSLTALVSESDTSQPSPPSSLAAAMFVFCCSPPPARNVQQGSQVTSLCSQVTAAAMLGEFSLPGGSFRQFSLPGQFSTVAKAANACHLSSISRLRSSKHHLSQVGTENG